MVDESQRNVGAEFFRVRRIESTARADEADDASDLVREAASDAKQQVQDVAGNVRGAIDKSVKDQPLTTLIMAVAVGFVVGALWKS